MSTEWDGAQFRKADDSNDVGCVEVAFYGGKIGIRDSKDHGTGLVLAFLSLRSMQQRVQRRLNWAAGWLFVAAMSLLCGAGVYAGRFLRWNSWDVVVRPWLIVNDLADWLLNVLHRPLSIAFPVLFAMFLFTVYLTLVAISTGEDLKQRQ